MEKSKKKGKALGTDNFDESVLKIGMGLLIDERTSAIVMPYITKLPDDDAISCLKLIAGLLYINEDMCEKFCKEKLGSEADFFLMMVKELRKIIEKTL